MISRELKNFFANYQIATQTFNKKTIEKSLSNYFTKEALFNFCHPFGTFKGLNNFLSKCILPLLDSIPDLERRDMILLAGTTTEGRNWVGSMGNYMGTFIKPFLNIPPNGHLVHMRYHEFFCLEENKIVEMQIIWDIPELMMLSNSWPMSPQLGACLCLSLIHI